MNEVLEAIEAAKEGISEQGELSYKACKLVWGAARKHCPDNKAFNAFLFELEYASLEKAYAQICAKDLENVTFLFMESARAAAADFEKHSELVYQFKAIRSGAKSKNIIITESEYQFKTIDMLAGWMDGITSEEFEKFEVKGKYYLHGLAIACTKLVRYCANPKRMEHEIIHDIHNNIADMDIDTMDATYICSTAIQEAIGANAAREFWIWYLEKGVYEALEKHMIRE